MSTQTRDVRRTPTLITAIAVGMLAAALVSGTVLAGKPSGGSSSSSGLAGPILVTDVNGDGLTNHGDSVTFKVSSSAAKPYVGVRCWQGSAFIYDNYVGYYAGAWFATSFQLESSYWVAGASATCTARLFSYDNRGRERVQSTLNFAVAP
jgi:hypothetical protein